MVNLSRARSFEGIFVVERDRTSPKEAILVSYVKNARIGLSDHVPSYLHQVLCAIADPIRWTENKTYRYCPFSLEEEH